MPRQIKKAAAEHLFAFETAFQTRRLRHGIKNSSPAFRGMHFLNEKRYKVVPLYSMAGYSQG